jgi:hypothetical protein
MTIGELCYGRGTPMSLHELIVVWPLYDDYVRRQREQAEKDAAERQKTFGGRR